MPKPWELDYSTPSEPAQVPAQPKPWEVDYGSWRQEQQQVLTAPTKAPKPWELDYGSNIPKRTYGPQGTVTYGYNLDTLLSSSPTLARLESSFASGMYGLGAAVGSAVEALGTAGPVASETLQDIGQGVRTYYQEAGKTAKLRSLEEVNWTSPGDVTSWVAEAVANQVPVMAATYGGGAMGTLAAKPAQAVGSFLLKQAVPAGVAEAASAGAGSGAVAYVLNAGETYANLREKGLGREEAMHAAGITGFGKAILDTALPAKIFGQIKWLPVDTMAKKAPGLLRHVLEGAAIEGSTEAGQEAMDILTEMNKNVYTPGEAVSRLLNSFAVGFVTGGPAEAVAHFVTPRQEGPPPQLTVEPPPSGTPEPLPLETIPPTTPPPPVAPAPDPFTYARERILIDAVEKGIAGTTEAEIKSTLDREFSAPEVREVLGIRPDAPIDALVEHGLLEKVGDDTFKLSDKAKTPMPETSPIPMYPGWATTVEEKPRYIYTSPVDPSKTWEASFAPGDPAKGTEDTYTAIINDVPVSATFLDGLQDVMDRSVQEPEAPIEKLVKEVQESLAQEEAPPPSISKAPTEEVRRLEQEYGFSSDSSIANVLPEELRPSYDPTPQKLNVGSREAVGHRWSEDPEAVPGDPVYMLTSNAEGRSLTVPIAAIMEIELGPDEGLYQAVIQNPGQEGSWQIGPYEKPTTAARAAEFLADHTGELIERPAIQAMAVNKKGRIFISSDPAEMTKILATSLYAREALKTAVKESIQNSVDAVRYNTIDNPGWVDVEVYWGPDSHYTSISDNGVGMSADLITNVLTELGKPSYKRTDADSTGGFGIAAAAIFKAGKEIILHTTTKLEDGSYQYSTFTATPDELFNPEEGADLVVTNFPALPKRKTGTTITTEYGLDEKLPGDIKSFADRLKYSFNLPGNLHLTIREEGQPDITVDIPAHSPVSRSKKLFSVEVPGSADVDVYGSDETIQNAGSGELKVKVLCAGLYQFDLGIGVDNILGLPLFITADVRPSVKAATDNYPFTANREEVRDFVMKELRAAIHEKLVVPKQKAATDFLAQKYKNLPSVPGTKIPGLPEGIIYDNGGRLTPDELHTLQNDPWVKRFLLTLNRVVNGMQVAHKKYNRLWTALSGKTDPLGLGIERVGLLVGDKEATTWGVWVPNPAASGSVAQATLCINPFAIFSMLEVSPANLTAQGNPRVVKMDENALYIKTRNSWGGFSIDWDDLRAHKSYHDKWDVTDDGGKLYASLNSEQEAKDYLQKHIEGKYGEEAKLRNALEPDQYAEMLWHTIKHEFLHDQKHGGWDSHDARFAFLLGASDTLLGGLTAERLRMEVKNSVTERGEDGNLRISQKLTPAFQINEESRSRPATEEDLLGGKAMEAPDDARRSEGESGEQGEVGGDVGPGRETDFGPTPAPARVPPSDKRAVNEVKSLRRLTRNFDSEVRKQAEDDYSRFWNLLRHAETLLQLENNFPNNRFLKGYVESARKYWKEKTRVLLSADKVAKPWMKLGIKNMLRLDKLIRAVEAESLRRNTRLTLDEVRSIAEPLGGATDKIVEQWALVDSSMQRALLSLREALVHEAERIYGPLAVWEIDKIDKDLGPMRQVNYFPGTRFGKWAVEVKATAPMTFDGRSFKKGDIVHFESRELRFLANKLSGQLSAKYAGKPVRVSRRLLSENEKNLLSFPPALTDFLAEHLFLTPQQLIELRNLQYAFAPGRGMAKHMMKKKGIPGASMDTLRVFMDYFQHLSGHIGKLEARYDLEYNLAGLKKEADAQINGYNAGLLAKTVENHYASLLNPGNEFGAIRGGITTYYFGANLAAGIVNLAQIPQYTYPYFAKMVGDVKTAVALKHALVNATKMVTQDPNTILSREDLQFVERGKDDGFLDESQASEAGALATGNMLSRFLHGPAAQIGYQVRRTTQASLLPFKTMEEYNRRVTFLAGLEIGRGKGLSGEELYNFARKAVEMTQFEYARWNRPTLFTGWRAPLFIFKMYAEHALYFALTGQGGWRFWAMLLALGGLKGIPLSDDLLKTFNMLGTWFKEATGMRNPKVDAEASARTFLREWGANPDLLMNGFARYGFGLTGLNTLFGWPFPAADFSGSVHMERLIPGVQSVTGLAQGTMRWPEAFVKLAGDLLGAGGNTAMNIGEAVLDQGPNGRKWLKALPIGLRSWAKAIDMATSGAYRNAKGEPLVDVDITKGTQAGDIAAAVLGKNSTRINQQLNARAMAREHIAYYLARRENILTAWATAIGMKDPDGVADARAEWLKFVQVAPPQFRIKGADLKRSLLDRVKGNKIQELGLPEQARYIQIYKEAQANFGQ